MNISRQEQRVLHVLALGGAIHVERASNGKVHHVACHTREGHILEGCDLDLFTRLRKRRFIKSTHGHPYRITPLGGRAVRAQMFQR